MKSSTSAPAPPTSGVGVSLVLALLLVLWWAVTTRTYAETWTDRLALARHIALLAPEKPRALMNYGVLLASRGQLADGRALLTMAERANARPYIRSWDRRQVRAGVAQNLAALADLERP